MTLAITPLVIAIIGFLLWYFAKNPKISEAGKILFIIGALAFTFAQGSHSTAFSFQLK